MKPLSRLALAAFLAVFLAAASAVPALSSSEDPVTVTLLRWPYT